MKPLLNARRLGEQGPALLCLHGLYGAGRNWQSIARELSARYRVWLVDLRNHGKSFHDEVWTYAAMAEDVGALVDALGLESFALLGHSMGGKVAMELALSHPQGSRLSRLAIADIAPRPYPLGEHQRYLDALASLELSTLSSREQADAELSPAIPDVAVRRFLLSNLGRGGSGWEWQFNLPVLRRDIGLITANIDLAKAPFTGCPVMFIAGADSDYLRVDDEPALREVFPQAEIHRLAGAGHWVQADQPAAVLSLLRDFLG